MGDDETAREAVPGRVQPEVIEDLVNVAIVAPPDAVGSEAAARQEALAAASREDRAALAALANEQPWLVPLRSFACGHYLVTQGLHDLTGGPELEVVNVPAVFLPSAVRLLQLVARHLARGEHSLQPGQVVNLGEAGVILLAATAPDEFRAGEHAEPPLRVVFLA
jgi:hypothetical protein